MNDNPPVSPKALNIKTSPTVLLSEKGPDANSEENALAYLQYWPALLVGILITMGVMGINPVHLTPQATTFENNLGIWLPPALFVLLFLLAVITLPRIKVNQETPWAKRERETREKALEKQAQEVQKKGEHGKVSDATAQTAAKQEVAPAAIEKAPAPVTKAITPGDVDVLILWGSETGTAQGLAEMSETRIKEKGLSVRAVSMADVTLHVLAGFKQVLVITSTWGDGEPPSNGIDLWESFQKEKVDMSKTQFSVLSLGDTAYPLFCKCGKDFDQFFEAQGAKRLYPRVDCDLDYEANFDKWLTGVQQGLTSVAVAA